ncbi:MAG: hypothetical protein II938_00160 [Alphaproteobacteria bacterium]|nr:hypothetical protein [Alphaproteobacteria bacterium]
MELTARQLRTQEEIRIRKAAEQYRKKLERTVAGKRTMYAIARNPVLRINFLSTCINQK